MMILNLLNIKEMCNLLIHSPPSSQYPLSQSVQPVIVSSSHFKQLARSSHPENIVKSKRVILLNFTYGYN